MTDLIVKKNFHAFSAEITPPGDKSISHRAIILGSLARGKTRARGFLSSRDTLATVNAVRHMGIDVNVNAGEVQILGKGLFGLKMPRDIIDAENSGTTARLLAGLLSAQNFPSAITGDLSLRRRPMSRITVPLRKMGAKILGRGETLPIHITGSELEGIEYDSPVASAQVKSSLLLAGLYARGKTCVTEPKRTRDHTERMLSHFGVPLKVSENCVSIDSAEEFSGTELEIPSDISSAAFLIVAALINPGSEIVIKNVGLNPLRTGVLDIFLEMGGDISIENFRECCGEPVGDVIARHCILNGVRIEGELVSRAIDELPVISVAACFAEGQTVISEAEELRVKETDRIRAMTEELSKLGADIQEMRDGMVINGTQELHGARCHSHGDHRVAMSLAVAATRALGETVIEDTDCVSVSFPGFFQIFDELENRK